MERQRRAHRKRGNYNLFGILLQWIYTELGIASDKDVAQRAATLAAEKKVAKGLHQTTISTIRRTRRASPKTLQILIGVFQSYPGWQHVLEVKPTIEHDLFVAADRADPQEQAQIQGWLKGKYRNKGLGVSHS